MQVFRCDKFDLSYRSASAFICGCYCLDDLVLSLCSMLCLAACVPMLFLTFPHVPEISEYHLIIGVPGINPTSLKNGIGYL